MHVDIELGGKKRRLALNENAIIALQDLTGDDFFKLGKTLAKKDISHSERLRAMRLLTWALLSQSQDWDGKKETLKLVGEWTSDLKKKVEISNALGVLIEDYMKQMGLGTREFEGQMAPFVPTPDAVVERMIALAELGPGKHAVDLGAGDGRLMTAAMKTGATVDGYELHHGRFEALRAKLAEGNNPEWLLNQEDVRKAKIDTADVVFMYLLPDSNEELKPKLLSEMKPGALVISHDFTFTAWEPEIAEHLQADGDSHSVYVYRIPGSSNS